MDQEIEANMPEYNEDEDVLDFEVELDGSMPDMAAQYGNEGDDEEGDEEDDEDRVVDLDDDEEEVEDLDDDHEL